MGDGPGAIACVLWGVGLGRRLEGLEVGLIGKAPSGAVPSVFHIAPSFERLSLDEVSDRVEAAER